MSAGRLKILLACEWFVKYTAGLARGLADAGCDVVLLTRDHDHEFGDGPGAMREYVDATLAGRARHVVLPGRVRDPARLRAAVRIRRGMAAWAPDVVHVQDSLTSDALLAFATGLSRGHYALTIHDPAPHLGEGGHDIRTRTARRLLFGGAGLIFVHAKVLAEEVAARPEVKAPIEVIPHGFAAAPPAPLPSRPSLLFFGRVILYKGVDTLLEAMPHVWERIPEVTLTVAGSHDVGIELPAAVLADPRVTIRDEHVPEAEVSALFAAASLVVLPYRGATQSGVGADAKRFGRGMIATQVGGLPEAVTPDLGRLVAADDPPALAAAIVEVLEDPELVARFAAAAAATSGESWDDIAVATVAAYRRHLLKGS